MVGTGPNLMWLLMAVLEAQEVVAEGVVMAALLQLLHLGKATLAELAVARPQILAQEVGEVLVQQERLEHQHQEVMEEMVQRLQLAALL